MIHCQFSFEKIVCIESSIVKIKTRYSLYYASSIIKNLILYFFLIKFADSSLFSIFSMKNDSNATVPILLNITYI